MMRLALAMFLLAIPAMAAERVKLEVTPVEPIRIEQRGQTYFADFGEDAYANLQITFPADVPTTALTIRVGEKLASDGSIDRKPPGSVIFYQLKLQTKPGTRTYELTIPSVKRHAQKQAVRMPHEIGEVTPFRYAEIDGSPLPLDKSSLRQLFVHAPFNDNAASFECSDDTLNAVWKLCHHTMKATSAFGVYIDGERERISYEADAYINLLSHYACDLDPRVARYSFEHLLKFPTWPTEWSLHMPQIAAADYEATGDPVLAAQHYEALKQKLLMNHARGDGLLRAEAVVDWPPSERDGYNDGQISTKDPRQIGPEINTVVNAFYYHALRAMTTLAKATHHDADAAQFEQLATQVAQSFQKVFFNPQRNLYIDGEGSTHASLHANMFPLAFGLVPAEHQKSVIDFIKSRGMACSVYGAQYLLDGLFEAGQDNYAVSLMTARTQRSWWHMIDLGSTMTLEAWDAQFKSNLTWNHAWGAAPANLIARHVLGVQPLFPGYAKIQIAPQIGQLQWARGKVPTPHGPVTVELQNSNPFQLTIEIPPGTTARVILPSLTTGKLRRDGKTPATETSNNHSLFDAVPEGQHVFSAE